MCVSLLDTIFSMVVPAEGVGGWTKVGRKQHSFFSRGGWDVAVGGKGKDVAGTVSSFFITEFGTEWCAKDLFHEFSEFGELIEVVIPPRKDRRGRRFGFARFLNVKDENMLATKLDNLMLDGKKLFANLPRYQRGVKASAGTSSKGRNVTDRVNGGKRVYGGGGFGSGKFDNRSFAEVASNRRAAESSFGGNTVLKSFVVKAEPEDLTRYGRAFVGSLKNPASAPMLKNMFIEEGIFTIRVTLLGPNLCLLEDLIFGEVEIFIEERRAWWEEWFSSIRAWRPKDVDMERLTWLKISGLPCHAWGVNTFKIIGESYGSFIKCSDQTITRLKMDEAKCLIKTNIGVSIDEECVVTVEGESFRCFLKEEFHLGILASMKRESAEEVSEESSSPSDDGPFGEEEEGECDISKVPLTFDSQLMATHDGDVRSREAGSEIGGKAGTLVQNASGDRVSLSPFGAVLESVDLVLPGYVPSVPHAINALNEKGDVGPVNVVKGVFHSGKKVLLGDSGECGKKALLGDSGSGCGPKDLDLKKTNADGRVFGPSKEMDKDDNPLSFDSVCRKTIAKSKGVICKTKKKKLKQIHIFNDKVNSVPSYFASIAPRNSNFVMKTVFEEGLAEEENDNFSREEDEISNGTCNTCLSLTDSDVRRCNHRFLNSSLKSKGGEMWMSMSRLGVVGGTDGGGECDYVRKVDELERGDRRGAKGVRECTKGKL